MSEVQRRNANNWFDQTLYSRLNDKRTGGIVIVMQRLHLDDLVGHVLEKSEHWEHICLPMIAEEDETWDYSTVHGPVRHSRRAGELLHPEREPMSVVENIRENNGSLVFAAQYQQSPVPMGGQSCSAIGSGTTVLGSCQRASTGSCRVGIRRTRSQSLLISASAPVGRQGEV